ncbi:hypothetical protein Noc_0431 [Nitrosococcus oceani ATCC 19707]|uniref:Uncharacterized protein n=1 Tax=Nitrosococcus oceani (strain ATCC 19707 / BCRC 17464 / JCM 30415 / NCIMB 11848 / C-107) TaxID=323261 RepID=Q3JDZ1_NITOC|nr:hypothetical protein [Nitrosococcus oceani]ABA56955.1 hypothetical protein Noc_0431 [Nitrosococcus oceani ATCC 19707]EDZ65840.1 hypothetical protein NOC27_2520 [Nitrosococcus oceani AFC27]
MEKERYVEPGYVEEEYVPEPLKVRLTPEEEKAIGQNPVELIWLAEQVYEYWRANTPSA